VAGSFAAYALHERAAAPEIAPAPPPLQVASAPTSAPQPINPPPRIGAEPPTAAPPTAAPPTAAPQVAGPGQLHDGTFTGPVVDAYYGNVQVEVKIAAGQIVDVQFLDYPHDRRTSQRINRVAMPYLSSEVIRAQSASVDVVSGATLTSEAFVQSLQSAIASARS
jgi:uncharacterized protein with FMN-binding domain